MKVNDVLIAIGMLVAGVAIVLGLSATKDDVQTEFKPEAGVEIGASFSLQNNSNSTTYNAPEGGRDRFLAEGRSGEKCYVHSSDLLLSHGSNGECFVLGVDRNHWFINPAGGRVLLGDCPTEVSPTILNYRTWKELSRPYPGYNSLQQWTQERLESMRCSESLYQQLSAQANRILMEGGN